MSSMQPDSALQQTVVSPWHNLQQYFSLAEHRSVVSGENKKMVNDIEQYNSSSRTPVVFVILVLLLGVVTYLKIAFNNDLGDLLQSVVNQNLSQQIFRTQSKEISFSSALLNLNFIVVISLYVWFILVRYFHVSSPERFSTILLIIFLFTFFYLAKLSVIRLTGIMFEVNEVCDEYIFNFTTICKTLGLTLLPALFVFYTAPVRFFNFIFIITVLICIGMLLIVAWRGLSTGYKLLYRSVYHFFIYVCVVEVSTIFLLFKLLTKTIT
jgi:hypothetical protein